MKKNTIRFLCIVLMPILLLSGCSWGKKTNTNTPAATVVNTETIDYYSGAVMEIDSDPDSGEESFTGELTQEERSEVDIVRSGDKEKCEALTGTGQEECKDRISYNTAVDSLKYDSCDTIVDKTIKQECISKISKELYNVAGGLTDCSKIRDTDIKATCTLRFSATLDTKNGLTSCASIPDKKGATQCIDEYYLGQIRLGLMKDIAICDKITNTLGKRECRIRINQISATAIVKNDSIGEIAKVECAGNAFCMKQKIVAEGTKTGDIAQCGTISDKNMQKVCTDEIASLSIKTLFNDAVEKKDLRLCEKITDAKAMSRCKEIVGR